VERGIDGRSGRDEAAKPAKNLLASKQFHDQTGMLLGTVEINGDRSGVGGWGEFIGSEITHSVRYL
jgi:hypothetical protein